MMNKLIIIGAGGHGRVIAEIAELNGYNDISFLDDANNSNPLTIGRTDQIKKYISTCDFFVGIGDNAARERFIHVIEKQHGSLVSLIHPKATVSKSAIIGYGSVVMAGAVINTGAKIGNGVIVNTCSSIDHDSVICDFVHVSVGAHIAGATKIARNSFIGAGATVINNVSIFENCIVGAGATVISDLTESGTYVGIPARRIK